MELSGYAFPPRSSKKQRAVLVVSDDKHVTLQLEHASHECETAALRFSERVGRLPVKVTLANGWGFLADNSDEIGRCFPASQSGRWLRCLERNLLSALVCAVATVLVLIGSYKYVLPWATKNVFIHWVPDTVVLAVADHVLEHLDKQFESSTLPIAQQQMIRAHSQELLENLAPLPYPLRVEFRASKGVVNAFALSGGTIILMDELVLMAETPEQLDSIILHEIGHLHHQHVMQQLVRASILSISVAFLTGESSGIIDNMVGLGVFVLQTGMSREAETEADQYAIQAMKTVYGSTEEMVKMFEHLHLHYQTDDTDDLIPTWMSTHPEFDVRINMMRD
ncbi:M48 family metallopeptidase [Vibrio mexicanus]|uniref:M48 family metallopeptidase n=1 Tax=Vibrio mexicanus TaxID=1004326 RepID=UPI00063C53E4|nr:M48 family metallopeptidase [Vibrio mexicanus]